MFQSQLSKQPGRHLVLETVDLRDTGILSRFIFSNTYMNQVNLVNYDNIPNM